MMPSRDARHRQVGQLGGGHLDAGLKLGASMVLVAAETAPLPTWAAVSCEKVPDWRIATRSGGKSGPQHCGPRDMKYLLIPWAARRCFCYAKKPTARIATIAATLIYSCFWESRTLFRTGRLAIRPRHIKHFPIFFAILPGAFVEMLLGKFGPQERLILPPSSLYFPTLSRNGSCRELQHQRES
jgi:hypothetical protein